MAWSTSRFDSHIESMEEYSGKICWLLAIVLADIGVEAAQITVARQSLANFFLIVKSGL